MIIRLNPDADGGGGGAVADPTAELKIVGDKLAKLEAAEARRLKASEASGFADQLKARENDAIGYARDLHRELTEAREKLAQAEGRVPAGSVVASAKDIEALDHYRKLGKAEELTKAIEDGKAAAERASRMERAEELRTVAEVGGFNPRVLSTLAADLRFEIRDEKVGARDAKVAYVVPREGEDGQPIRLADHAAKQWAEFLPSLRPGQAQAAPGLPRGHQSASSGSRPVPAPMGSRVEKYFQNGRLGGI
ncbi:hypothetical protein EP7_005650 (plasmid) [Isosphaeraceae bacterium EP7]